MISFGRPSPWTVGEVHSSATCLALLYSNQLDPKEPNIYSELKAVVSDVWEEQQQYFFMHEKQSWVEDRAIPIAQVKTTVTGNEETSKVSCSRGARCPLKHTSDLSSAAPG